MTRDDTGLLVVAGGVTSQLEDLGGQVLQDGGEVDGGTSTDSGGVVAVAEVTVDTTDGELETSLAGSRSGLGVRSSLEGAGGRGDEWNASVGVCEREGGPPSYARSLGCSPFLCQTC